MLQYYDSDKKIPLLGFGGNLPPYNLTSHKFAVNGNAFDPEVFGLDEVIDSYKHSLNHVKLYGPTNFASVITEISEMAEAEEVS